MTTFFNNPYVQYIFTPAIVWIIVVTVVGFLFARVYKFGEFINKARTALGTVTDLDKEVKKLNNHVVIIKTHLVDKTGLDANLFGPGSPLKLLPGGIKILEKTGFKHIYTENKKWFIEEAKKYKFNTLAEIDETSLKIIEHCSKEKKFADYKEIAFQNGITIDVLLRILAIYLRDELAKEILTK